MGIFSVKPHSIEEIEPHISFYSELTTRRYGNMYHVASGQAASPFAFTFFSEEGHFLIDKQLRVGSTKLPKGWLGKINYNRREPFDTRLAQVTLQVTDDVFTPRHSRYVDVSDSRFDSFVTKPGERDEAAEENFCIRAIAKGALSYLNGEEEPSWASDRVEAAKELYDLERPRRHALIEAYTSKHLG